MITITKNSSGKDDYNYKNSGGKDDYNYRE